MFYILLKNPEHYFVVKQKLTCFCCQIFDVRAVVFNESAASIIYSDLKGLAYFKSAVNSITNKTILVIRFTHPVMTVGEIKKLIQGPYGNFDDSTIRGYITIYLNDGVVDSFVHVPDTIEKMDQDLSVIEKSLC